MVFAFFQRFGERYTPRYFCEHPNHIWKLQKTSHCSAVLNNFVKIFEIFLATSPFEKRNPMTAHCQKDVCIRILAAFTRLYLLWGPVFVGFGRFPFVCAYKHKYFQIFTFFAPFWSSLCKANTKTRGSCRKVWLHPALVTKNCLIFSFKSCSMVENLQIP